MWYEIFKFELKYRAKRADTYLYFALLFGYALIAVDFIFTENLDPVKRNAPFIIAKTMGIIAALFTMVTSMIMGVAALRDFDHHMSALMFVNPIKKGDYLLGRFLGSFVVLIFIFSSVPIGLILGDFMPWRLAEALLPFDLWRYIHPFLIVVLPNLFFTGAIFFVAGALSRKLLVVYTQGIILLMAYIFSIQWGQGQADGFIPALIDPFFYQAINRGTQFWSTTARNTQMVGLEGVLLCNRLLWIAIGWIVLGIGYYGFSFNVIRNSFLKQQKKATLSNENLQNLSTIKIPEFDLEQGVKSKLIQLKYHSLFYFQTILKEVPFWAIVICGMAIIFINSINLGTTHGVDTFPVTYIIVEELQEMSIFFFLIILIFYSGELVWKERDAKVDGVYDALPVSDSIPLTGKFIGLTLAYLILIGTMIGAGILFQTVNGFYEYELGVYFMGFFVNIFPSLILLTILSFFIQVVVNHKFLGHFVVVTVVLVSMIGLRAFGFDHGLYNFGAGDMGIYSAMNGHGHFLWGYAWFTTYWMAFAIGLFLVATLLSVRGMETNLIKRIRAGRFRLTPRFCKISIDVFLIFLFSGGYIFYNTNILNDYALPSTAAKYQVAYEQTLKKYETLPQPKIVATNLKLELYPEERDYKMEGFYWLTNLAEAPIEAIHVQKIPGTKFDLAELQFSKAGIRKDTFVDFGYYIYSLTEPLLVGDSIKMNFKQNFTTNGFTEGSNTRIVYNGTFFDNMNLPSLGYNHHIELQEERDRKQYGLLPKPTKANRDNPLALKERRKGDDSQFIDFEITIGTAGNQTALAPGTLQKKWTANDRNYFHYKMNAPMINFYPIASAEYEVLHDKWKPKNGLDKPIELEIYYHKGHEYNLDGMMDAMKKSFDYFTKNFSPYPYEQMRIMEVPRYKNRAQSFPTLVAYSESMGFIMDVKADNVDMPFFITAHELAHQWWGLQVAAANVKGQKTVLESLAQYSALMVLKAHYSEEKVREFLKIEEKNYLSARANAKKIEVPLTLVDDQSYIYYRKGSLNLFALQAYISEDSVNLALKRFIRDWNSFDGLRQKERYATTADLLEYFSAVTPDSLQYLIPQLFETVTLFDNKIANAAYEKLNAIEYKVKVKIDMNKFQLDRLGIEKTTALNDWVDVAIYGKEEEVIYHKKYKIKEEMTDLEIVINQQPIKVIIDPNYLQIDKDRKDNERNF